MNTSFFFRSLLGTAIALALAEVGQAQDVPSLIQQLGSKQYQTRENAHRVLRKEIHREDVMERLRGPFPDAEIDQRASQLREDFVLSLKPENLPTLPWIDMLLGTKHPEADHIVRHYLSLTNGHGRAPMWHGDQEATRLWVRDLVAKKVPREQIVAILNKMGDVQKQSVWYKDYLKDLGK